MNFGKLGDNGVIRIGISGTQTSFFAAAIRVSRQGEPAAVYSRYQKPYADGSKPRDYGLIAEEVAEVYPELVVKGTDGQIETVQYHKLIPMLLNEVQKGQHTITALQSQAATQENTILGLQAQLSAVRKGLETLMRGPSGVLGKPRKK